MHLIQSSQSELFHPNKGRPKPPPNRRLPRQNITSSYTKNTKCEISVTKNISTTIESKNQFDLVIEELNKKINSTIPFDEGRTGRRTPSYKDAMNSPKQNTTTSSISKQTFSR